MHMSDALISPVVGAAMWAGTAGAAAYSIRGIHKRELMESNQVPLMGVMGAFVFAAQMLNFTIPGTGSSGHLGGGLLLAAVLGPEAGFLTMAVILFIQALFFADGGLLALGCNVINLGFFTCFVAYPLIFRPLLKKGATPGRIALASLLAAVAGLQLGSLGVVLQTLLSGKTELPFGAFLLLMQPIHLAIGVIEGLITSAVLVFLSKTEPEVVASLASPASARRPKRAVVLLAALTVLCGGLLSWFASSNPDGLEWSIAKVSGREELSGQGRVHDALDKLQQSLAILPDYGFKQAQPAAEGEDAQQESWPQVNAGTSTAGLTGSAATLGAAAFIGLLLHWRRKQRRSTGTGA